MIDIEQSVYSAIRTMLSTEHSTVTVSNEFQNAPSKFPFVSIEEVDNYNVDLDSGDSDARAIVMYEINVYTNNANSKKKNAKKIMNDIDSLMYKMNFQRLSLAPIPNRDDATIYRINARYRAKTDGDNIYRG